MVQEFISPTNNHVFELNNRIKDVNNKVYNINNKIDNLIEDNTQLKKNIEDLKNKLLVIENGGHDFVEIAGIKWATMNVGANSITDTGLYFQWGDTQGYTSEQVGTGEGKKKFAKNWSDYKFTTDGGSTFTKYNETDKKTVLDLGDDAVHAAWGGYWRMPTKEEINTVLNSTAVTKTWKTGYNGTSIAGYELHDNNSNDTLFLPACGYAFDGTVNNLNYSGTIIYGLCWVSNLNDNTISANSVRFFRGDVGIGSFDRYYGQCVRGVLDIK